MSGGDTGHMSDQRPKPLTPLAAGQECQPARGPSYTEPGEFFGLCKALAERSTPLTEEERAAFNAMRAREMAKAESRRAEQSPQGDLELAA